ncbi:MAG: hypothetical protein Q9218_005514 [Villophora microphyllina]
MLGAGREDLRHRWRPWAVYGVLKVLWKLYHDGGANVLALTVPEEGLLSKRMSIQIEQLNEMIRTHRDSNFFVADVCKAVPYTPMDPELRKKVWDDKQHLTPMGYVMIGNAIADRLLEILQKPTIGKPRL